LSDSGLTMSDRRRGSRVLRFAERLAKVTTGSLEAQVEGSNSQYVAALNALLSAAEPESSEDRRILQAILDHYRQLLDHLDSRATMVIPTTRASRNAHRGKGAA
jgi:hypothetical protein